MRKVNNHICCSNHGRHQQNQEHNPKGRDENAPKYHGIHATLQQNTQPGNKTNLQHTGHCKIDEANTSTEWKTIEMLKLRETENHTIEDRQADHQRGGGIAGCRSRKELLTAGKTG